MEDIINLYKELGIKSDELRLLLEKIKEKQSHIFEGQFRLMSIVKPDADKFERLCNTKYL